jgi:excinuclease ABC subunit A
VVIEHNLDVIKTADHIIDLGPEGGDEGGRVVASGTPEEVVRNRKSYTGQALVELLGSRAGKQSGSPRAPRHVRRLEWKST